MQPKISRHLAQLRQNKLLLDSREGQWVYYQINPGLPEWVIEILDVAVKQPNARQQEDSARLQSMRNALKTDQCRG